MNGKKIGITRFRTRFAGETPDYGGFTASKKNAIAYWKMK
jgi:hypothetical protein